MRVQKGCASPDTEGTGNMFLTRSLMSQNRESAVRILFLLGTLTWIWIGGEKVFPMPIREFLDPGSEEAESQGRTGWLVVAKAHAGVGSRVVLYLIVRTESRKTRFILPNSIAAEKAVYLIQGSNRNQTERRGENWKTPTGPFFLSLLLLTIRYLRKEQCKWWGWGWGLISI